MDLRILRAINDIFKYFLLQQFISNIAEYLNKQIKLVLQFFYFVWKCSKNINEP